MSPKKLICILAVTGLSLLFSCSGICQEPSQNKFLVLTIDNKIISPVIADYISRGIDEAEGKNYSGVIIVMDTPGGLLESTRIIVKKIMNSPLPVITYIAPSGSRAGSAGVFITLASHIAAMAPSTNIGAAHPVMMGEEQKGERSLKRAIENLTETLRSQGAKKPKKEPAAKSAPAESQKEISENPMEDKVLNDTLAWISTIAKNRDRNAEWAKEAVLESISATENEALEKKVIDLVAVDLNDLLKKIDGKTISLPEQTITLNTKDAELIYHDLTLRQNILNTIITPNIAYILMLVGFLGLFIEITHPGVIFPGIVGVICLIIAFYAFAMLPVNFAGFLLIALAILFFIAEALTPVSFGLLTLAGAISMLIGSLMLINSPFVAMRVSLNIILPFILAIAAIVIFLATNIVKTHKKKVLTGPQVLIGQAGIAQTDIEASSEGQVFVMGEIWTAINESNQPIKKGEKIKVSGVDRIKLLVSKWEA